MEDIIRRKSLSTLVNAAARLVRIIKVFFNEFLNIFALCDRRLR